MQFEITDEAAITFAGEFYTALAEGFSVDTAVAEARKAIYAQPNDVEWGTPVLYMRSPDGVLFSIQEHEEPEHQRHEQIATLYKQARGLVLVGQWQQASEKMKEIRALDPQFADPEGIALRVQEELARKEPKQDRIKPSQLPPSFEIAVYGCIGGVIAGLIIGVIYYYTSKEYLGWFIILEVVVYASLIGTTVSILSQLCILWFHRLVSERRYPALVFNEVSGGILGGVITGILFGAFGGGYFGLRETPPVNIELLVGGTVSGAIFLVFFVLLYNLHGRLRNFVRALFAAVFATLSVAMSGFFIFWVLGIDSNWFY